LYCYHIIIYRCIERAWRIWKWYWLPSTSQAVDTKAQPPSRKVQLESFLPYIYVDFYRDVVMMLSAITDPEGVEQRRKHRLKRRVYQNKVLNTILLYRYYTTFCIWFMQGPDFLWHIDGYDKLKPFGFPIHGCIDG